MLISPDHNSIDSNNNKNNTANKNSNNSNDSNNSNNNTANKNGKTNYDNNDPHLWLSVVSTLRQ